MLLAGGLLAAVLLPALVAVTAVSVEQAQVEYGIALLKASYPDHEWSSKPQVIPPWQTTLTTDPGAPYNPLTRYKRTSHRPTKDADLAQLYAENLAVDLALWSPKVPLRVADLLGNLASFRGEKSSRRLVLITKRRLLLLGQRSKDGKQYPVTEACVAPCNCILRSTLGALSRWAAAGILPDTLFLLNVADVAVCRDDPWGRTFGRQKPYECSVPVFSTVKQWYGSREGDRDIVIPALEDPGPGPPQATAQVGPQWSTQGVGTGSTTDPGQYKDPDELPPPPTSSTHSSGSVSSAGGGGAEGPDQNSDPTLGSNVARVRQQKQQAQQGSGEAAGVPAGYQGTCTAPGVWGSNTFPLYFFNTSSKIRRAFFRGRAYCPSWHLKYSRGDCSRLELAALSDWAEAEKLAGRDPGTAGLLDVGVVSNFTSKSDAPRKYAAVGKGAVPMSMAVRFRYLIDLDGISASTRLLRLMATNSPVLKQFSPHVLWFSRSLRHGTQIHQFMHSSPQDILQALKDLETRDPSGQYRDNLAAEAQHFVFKWAGSGAAKRLYWRRALLAYNDLFTDMQPWLESISQPGALDTWAAKQFGQQTGQQAM